MMNDRGGETMRVLFVMVACAVVLAACGGGDDKESAGDAATRQFDNLNKGAWAAQYDELHPAQQAFIPKDTFIECATQTKVSPLTGARIVSMKDDEIHIPGTGQRAKVKQVTVEYKVQVGTQNQVMTQPFPEANVDGKWRWIMGGNTESYKQGQCPA